MPGHVSYTYKLAKGKPVKFDKTTDWSYVKELAKANDNKITITRRSKNRLQIYDVKTKTWSENIIDKIKPIKPREPIDLSDILNKKEPDTKEMEEFKEKWRSSLNTKYIKDVPAEREHDNKAHWGFDEEKTKESFPKTYRDKDGYLRWMSNNSIPPADALSSFAKAGLISWDDALKNKHRLERENSKFFSKAREDIEKAHPSGEWNADPEELAEARANYDWQHGDRFLVNPVLGTTLDLKTGKWKNEIK